jgi:hypothetical protein
MTKSELVQYLYAGLKQTALAADAGAVGANRSLIGTVFGNDTGRAKSASASSKGMTM